MIEVNTWQVITFFITLALTLTGMFIGAGKMLMSQFNERLSKQFDGLESRLVETKEDIASAKNMAKKAMEHSQELRLHLAENYQHKEDAIRTDTVNMARYDAIASKLDQVLMQGNINKS